MKAKDISCVKKILGQCRPIIQDKYGVTGIGVFGSYARKEQTPTSDIDLLVRFSRPVGFFTFFDLREFLEKKLGGKVDMVTENALKSAIGRQIISEAVFV